MKEYLIIGNNSVIYRIDSAEIWYIATSTEARNAIEIFLTNGKNIRVFATLTGVEELINKYFKYSHGDFCRVGNSLIINMNYLFSINFPNSMVGLINRRADGFIAGYSTGYSDGKSDKKTHLFSFQKNEVTLPASRDALTKLKSAFEEKNNKK